MTKKLLIISLILLVSLFGCRKKNNYTVGTAHLDEKTTIISNSIIKDEIVAVDSTSLTFNNDSSVISEIKVGSILVSDMTALAEYGYLRKVKSISTINGKLVCQTETASIEEAIESASFRFKKKFNNSEILTIDSSGIDISAQQKKSRGASFKFSFNETVYDEDNDINTTNDQIKLKGDFEFEPEFEFEMDIDNNELKNLLVKLNLKNTNKLTTEAKIALLNLSEEKVLYTFQLAPFTIIGPLGFPIPIAKQSIAIVIGVDGEMQAKVTIGAENENNCSAGIKYENGVLNSISSTDNKLTFNSGDFEAKTNLEGWLKVRYDIRPYGLKDSKISLGVKGSAEADATISNNDLVAKLEWGISLDAKANFKIFSKTLLDYELTFFDEKYPIGNPIVIPFNLNSGLVAYYPFNGNANDESGNGNNGTVYGGASLSTDRHGNANKAYSFDGVDDYILLSSVLPVFGANGSRTISFWVKSNSNYSYPFFTSSNGSAFFINIDNNILGSYNYDNTLFSNQDLYYNNLPNTNNWVHIVYVKFDDGNANFVKLFANNLELNNDLSQPPFPAVDNALFSINQFIIGYNPFLISQFHNGSVDDLRIYDRALNASEIEVLYNN